MASSSSSSATPAPKFDVFLSFRGPDTRKNFVSHLYAALCRKGLYTYKDDEEMEKGGLIPDELIKAIKTSRFFIVVISENFDNSYWCLEELRAIMEVEAVKRKEDINVLIPIFYRVKPGRINRENLAAAFSDMKHPPMEETAMINEWENTLSQLANRASYIFSTRVDEATRIEEVVQKISDWWFSGQERDHADIVGIRSHMERLASLLEMESDDEVRIVGISGMEGVGKTTIADYLYSQFSRQFAASCFVDVKKKYEEGGQLYLEQYVLSVILGTGSNNLERMRTRSHHIKQKLRNRKVFVVLDDVDKVEQIHGLAKDKSWFGPGSRIIITTRDKGLLDTCGVQFVYPVKCLSAEDASQMFKQIVFKGSDPPAGFEQLLTRVSRLAYGLPSAIKTVAERSLCKWRSKTKDEWEKLVRKYEEAPFQNIVKILKSSYADLSLVDKIAFLYVACLFNGDDIKRVSNLLDDGESSIQVLVDKSLVDISAQGCINMNKLVENMGRETVVEESDLTPTKQRILWDPQIIYHVLRDKTGTESIKGLALSMCMMPDVLDIERRSFRKMHNMKYLKFHTRNKTSKLQLSPTARLPHMLKLLVWDAYPLSTLPSGFSSGCLVELTLRCSNLQFLWKTNLDLGKLKRLDVSESKELEELPDLSSAIQLEELAVEGCKSLTYLKDLPQSLNFLNAHGCSSLETVSLHSNHSIKHIDLSDCSRLNNDQELITHFLTQGQHDQEFQTLLRFACIPQTTMPSYFENCCPRLSPNLMGFSAGIMVACSGPYHLQFLESSYSWNREEPSITLKPQLYPDLERVEEEAMNYLVIIQVLSSINNNQPCKFLLELPSRFYSPPIEIKEGRVHMFH
ncbi:disease resistance protein RPP5 isoform X1 [Brassica rapa]|uniref:disease resistance protein RPP5 isoform X1 n=1 Tax=Brassica campestris TaxID=3711 RepID=UPI0004F19313|nr:disease resistance protein RPP5 isoform X1 [Brassica rapa]